MITVVSETTQLMSFKKYDTFIGGNSPMQVLMFNTDMEKFIPHEEVLIEMRRIVDDACNDYLYQIKEQEKK